jgi:hypothetical protein
MPAPVRRSVWALPLPLLFLRLIPYECRAAGNVGARNSASAAIAPAGLFARAGIIVGAGSGSVYGMRRRGARTGGIAGDEGVRAWWVCALCLWLRQGPAD